ncbi:MAG: class I adenylate-forming enzyme family protein [Vicinamibacterales bacterium]
MNLADVLRSHATRTPAATALLCGERSLTYGELDRSTDSLASWLIAEGLKPGDRVAIQWPNAIEVVQVFFAAFKAGLIAVPINLRLKPQEIAWVTQHAGAALCFAHPALADVARQTGVRTLDALPDGPAPDQPVIPPSDPDTPGLILYTSGSTGRPKGAVLSQRSLVATAELCGAILAGFDADLKARGLLMTPLMHSSGLFVLLSALSRGEPCVLLPAFDPATVLDTVQRDRCTNTLALPAMMQFVLEEQARTPRDVSSLRVVFAGGDSVPVPLQERSRALLGGVMLEGLAQTETGPTICNPAARPRLGSLGLPHAGVELRLVDVVSRNPVPDGEPGELLVRSAAVCSGYWNNPDATREAFEDGWFRTGDLVSRDADGYYWFRGRLKEIIIRGGSNISPQEVEEALYTHPDILEAGVIGLPHDVWGEVVVAVVALREGATATEADIREHARRTLADYKVPEQVHFLPALPKGPTGKVHRRALKEALAARPE